MRRENFETAAKDLFNLLKSAQTKFPNTSRILYVDIDDHLNKAGGFDSDMLELQKDFGIGFLGKYFTEMHFPLGAFENNKQQCNDIPDELTIFNVENKVDNSLNDLYIENYSNTEFVSEANVYDYLAKVHEFLLNYKTFNLEYVLNNNSDNGVSTWLENWRKHIIELVIELYNAFLYGNLLTVAAMTRTLIECYVYFKILVENDSLVYEWFICSLCRDFSGDEDKLREIIEAYCKLHNFDFDEKWNTYHDNKNVNKWLRPLIQNGKITFRTACDYVGDTQIYKDYEDACSFVHGQDVKAKMFPFTFYSSIFNRFHMMMFYILKAFRLFPLSDDLKCQIEALEDELLELVEKYCD